MGNLDRCRRDLVTNPAYEDLQAIVREGVRKEGVRLEDIGGEESIAAINTQAGVVKGMRLAMTLLENYRKLHAVQRKAA
jgi:hypothetical protein